MSNRRGRHAEKWPLNIKPKLYEFNKDEVDTETESEDDDESLHHHQIDDYSRRTQPNQPECPSRTSALMVGAANRPVEYDSDDEYIVPRQQIGQPLPSWTPPPATCVLVDGDLDQRPWSIRMREKYGLDTSEFTYDPSESGGLQEVSTQPAEERSR